MDGRNALYTASQFGAQGAQAAESFGIFNVIGLLTRAWQAWRHDPVSNQAIIDRGEAFLARAPHAPDAPAVHARLADAYERAGNYERALLHYRATPDPDPKRIEQLEGKMADKLLADAERGGGNPVLLSSIVRHFGATAAADKARKHLRERQPDGETVIGREVLQANPSLLAAFDLDPKLLDGDHDNGELADAGVTLSPGQMRLTLYNTDQAGQHIETRSLTSEAYERGRAAAEEALYARLLTAARVERRKPLHHRPAAQEDQLGLDRRRARRPHCQLVRAELRRVVLYRRGRRPRVLVVAHDVRPAAAGEEIEPAVQEDARRARREREHEGHLAADDREPGGDLAAQRRRRGAEIRGQRVELRLPERQRLGARGDETRDLAVGRGR